MDYVLRTNELVKSYRKFKALDGLTINVPKGSIYGLVGRNGAGKTTLIRIICGLQEPTGGTFTLYGVQGETKDIYNARRRIGALIETPAIYRDMSAKENLKQQYRVLGLPSFNGIEEILSLVGLSDCGKKKAGRFSLGMRQRLAIAIALCGNPDFLILDEPINGLDPQGIIEIRELILKLNREKQITVLISSHILEELSKIATDYGFIDKGRTVKELTAKELINLQRKCIRITVNSTKALAITLDELNYEYEISEDSCADVYGEINISELVLRLSQKGCFVKSIKEKDENLESYFVNLVGGEEND